jgi:hypothetical protein
MKLIFRRLLPAFLLAFVLLSCNNTEDIKSNGVLVGSISNLKNDTIDSIICVSNRFDNIIGKCEYTQNNKFTLTFSTPFLFKVGNFGSEVEISDTTVNYGTAEIYTLRKGSINGFILKSNFSHDPQKNMTVGDAFEIYMYVDKLCGLRGSETVGNVTRTYDLSLKAGWNNVLVKMTEFTTNGSVSKATFSYTTKVSTGLTWRFYPELSQYQLVKRLSVIRTTP